MAKPALFQKVGVDDIGVTADSYILFTTSPFGQLQKKLLWEKTNYF